MMNDIALALALQEEYDKEIWGKGGSAAATAPPGRFPAGQTQRSIVDPAWELLDPNPDISVLFQEFNAKYFWGKLSMVEVKWSPETGGMRVCAGVCCYEGRGGLCSIRLSQPLLRLRPRKDVVETLLHEMIHAFLFVTDNNKDHHDHGPEFCKHMKRINGVSGANVTIYHNFHDEVKSFQQYAWRCQGPCRNKPPYFGYFRRSTEMPPSTRESWWALHQKTCGGTYVKISEPEVYS